MNTDSAITTVLATVLECLGERIDNLPKCREIIEHHGELFTTAEHQKLRKWLLDNPDWTEPHAAERADQTAFVGQWITANEGAPEGLAEDVAQELLDHADRINMARDFDRLHHQFANAKLTRDQVMLGLERFVQVYKPKGEVNLGETLIRWHTPSSIQTYVPDQNASLAGDAHLVMGNMTVIGGPPGVGKSRALHALAIAGATGQDWFGLPVHRQFKTAILQSENGLRRLKAESERWGVDPADLDEWVLVTEPPDCGLAFARDDFRVELQAKLDEFRPDVFGIDPWSNVAFGDRKTDYDEAFELILACLPKGDARPAQAVVAHTRKPQGDEKHSGRALLHLLAGSYVLTSRPRCVFILQPGSDDPEDPTVVWTCCKNNDGNMGPRSAWLRRDGLFVPVEGFDWETFDSIKKRGRPPKITEEHMLSVFSNGHSALSKARAVDRLIEVCGGSRSQCYDALNTVSGRFAHMLRIDHNGLLSVCPKIPEPYRATG